ncbi:hypothetical protein MMC09_006561 [Bachmanniomyces sp. S44760]|nr:hypothetical protein [Bachmanniomyces sp. S44760]
MPPPLLTAQDVSGHIHLIIGSSSLANARCSNSIEAGAKVVIVAPANDDVHGALLKKIDDDQVVWIQRKFQDEDLKTLGREEVDRVVDAVFITTGSNNLQATTISKLCQRLRIPVNVTDTPSLCSFTLLTTYTDGPLQIGITTSGRGCKLASRIKREIASSLPPNLGLGIERLGTMRRRIREEDHRSFDVVDPNLENSDDDGSAQRPTFNHLITDSDSSAAKTRRVRWLSQMCEYWPLGRLASITDADIDTLLRTYNSDASNSLRLLASNEVSMPSISTPAPVPKPQIILAGSGPGAPSLLTVATHRAIQSASFILADKLVPSGVMDLIPRRTPVHIARKFPGNAEAAQTELLTLGLAALKKGHTVLRLKQGDPYIYGRGGEEYMFFREKGYLPIVLPGITSALSAPLFAAIPSTHRSVADQVLICTGTGRKGAAPAPPPYVESQTVVFLMALHRIEALVNALTGTASSLPSPSPTTNGTADSSPTRKGNAETSSPSTSTITITHSPPKWPLNTPCAVIERASCPDQRIIRTTLEHVVAAIEEEGSRPPGLLVVGWSCHVLASPEDEGKGEGKKWVVEEGWRDFVEDFRDVPVPVPWTGGVE